MNGASGVARMGTVGTGPLTSLQRAYSPSAESLSQPSNRWGQQETQQVPRVHDPVLHCAREIVLSTWLPRLNAEDPRYPGRAVGSCDSACPRERDGSRDGVGCSSFFLEKS